MKNYLSAIVLLLFMFVLPLLGQSDNSLNYIKSNVEFLASDIMNGREAGSKYEDISAAYLEAELKKSGLQPFGEDNSYIQAFKVDINAFDMNSTILLQDTDGNTIHELKPIEGFTTIMRGLEEGLVKVPHEMIFVGYGLSEKNGDYDDYKDLDVSGKIVVIAPGFPKEGYGGAQPKDYRSQIMKVGNAAAHGAKAVIFLPSEKLKYMWGMLSKMTVEKAFSLPGTKGRSFLGVPVVALQEESGSKLLEGEELGLENILLACKEGKELEKFSLKKKINLNITLNKQEGLCKNVVGVIEGKNKDEFIGIGGHYDHLGSMNGEVFNGADDNASGTAAILEVARKLASGSQPERSVIVMLLAAEEKGLLGSKYFVSKYEDKDNLLAFINVDMCGRFSEDTLCVRGAEETSAELFEIVKTVDDEFDFTFTYKNGLTDGSGSSDHTSFASAGIPIVNFGGEHHPDYHKPTDDADKINYKKIKNNSLAIEKIVRRVAELDHKLSREK